jgi:hypothetical protein
MCPLVMPDVAVPVAGPNCIAPPQVAPLAATDELALEKPLSAPDRTLTKLSWPPMIAR